MRPRLSSFIVFVVLMVCSLSLWAQDETRRAPGAGAAEKDANVLVLTLGEVTHTLKYAQIAPRPPAFKLIASAGQAPNAVIVKSDGTSSLRPYLVRRPAGVVRTDVLVDFNEERDADVIAIVLPAKDGGSLLFAGSEVLAAVEAAKSGRMLATLANQTGCGVCGCDSEIPGVTDGFSNNYNYCVTWQKDSGTILAKTCQTCYDCIRFFNMDFCSSPHTTCSDPDPCVSAAIGGRG